jgi:hypothetical protein
MIRPITERDCSSFTSGIPNFKDCDPANLNTYTCHGDLSGKGPFITPWSSKFNIHIEKGAAGVGTREGIPFREHVYYDEVQFIGKDDGKCYEGRGGGVSICIRGGFVNGTPPVRLLTVCEVKPNIFYLTCESILGYEIRIYVWK